MSNETETKLTTAEQAIAKLRELSEYPTPFHLELSDIAAVLERATKGRRLCGTTTVPTEDLGVELESINIELSTKKLKPGKTYEVFVQAVEVE